MKFSLVICTFMRPKSLQVLLESVKSQSRYPNEIIVVDGSTDELTKSIFDSEHYDQLKYFKVSEEHRGLTKQRNFGIGKVSKSSAVVAFVDDDTKLSKNYFEVLIDTYENDSGITGVGGVTTNEYRWLKAKKECYYPLKRYYQFEDYVYKEGVRNVLRNYLGLQSDKLPGQMPEFSNGRTCGYPITGKIYPVDLLVGMSFSFRKIVYDNVKFSTYFDGYGLYEDADYSIRALQFGKNVINTNLQLEHFHEASGRPNRFKYGKMVIRNGWYVWRVKYPKPSLKARAKWNAIAWLLTMVRLLNVITTKNRIEAFSEAVGRTIGWLSLCISKPNPND